MISALTGELARFTSEMSRLRDKVEATCDQVDTQEKVIVKLMSLEEDGDSTESDDVESDDA